MLPKYEMPKTEGESISWRDAILRIVGVVGLFAAIHATGSVLDRGRDVELKNVIRTAQTSQEIVARFGTIESVSVAKYRTSGWKRRWLDDWKRTRVFDGAKGTVALDVRVTKGWVKMTIDYRYTLSSDEFEVVGIKFGDVESFETHYRKLFESMAPADRRRIEESFPR